MLSRLAAVLAIAGITSITEDNEDRACLAITDMRRAQLAAEQERDIGREKIKTLETELAAAAAATAAAGKLAIVAKVDHMIESAYRSGKLTYRRDDAGKALPSLREPRLRKMAERDGIDELAAEIEELPVIAPINQRQLGDDPNPRAAKTPIAVPSDVLASTAKQLGLKVEDLEATAAGLAGGKE